MHKAPPPRWFICGTVRAQDHRGQPTGWAGNGAVDKGELAIRLVRVEQDRQMVGGGGERGGGHHSTFVDLNFARRRMRITISKAWTRMGMGSLPCRSCLRSAWAGRRPCFRAHVSRLIRW